MHTAGIANYALKQQPINSILHVTKLNNSNIKFCYYPKYWKTSIIFHIPKHSCNLNDTTIFRPICFLSSLSKFVDYVPSHPNLKISYTKTIFSYRNNLAFEPDISQNFRFYASWSFLAKTSKRNNHIFRHRRGLRQSLA